MVGSARTGSRVVVWSWALPQSRIIRRLLGQTAFLLKINLTEQGWLTLTAMKSIRITMYTSLFRVILSLDLDHNISVGPHRGCSNAGITAKANVSL